jgi:uncharacterized protein YfaS (alpha-2-macroglobulin family)
MRTLTAALLSCAACAAAVVLLPSEATAKPLYITVPRAFGTDESPVIDVAFAGHDPVELRVLQPEDRRAFLEAQGNLRRAYDPPLLHLNPGRFLAKGLNAIRQPGPYLRFALGAEFRETLAPALPAAEKEPEAGAPLSQLREGQPKLIGYPPGMKLVRSEWLNLDLGGRQRDYSVPGFDEWGGESRYEERRISLAPLPAGVYVLQLVQGKIEGQVILSVTDLTVQVKQTDGELLVRVAGRDQRPKAGSEVAALISGPKEKGPQRVTGTTDDKGEAHLAVEDPKVIVTAASGADLALVDTDFYSSLAVAPDVFIYTDRPIYKPGDTVHFRGVVRKPESFLVRLFRPKKREVVVRLISEEKRDVLTRATVDEFGSFSGAVKVPDGLDTGVLRIFAELDGPPPHQSEARVQQYVKPTFYLELLADQETVRPGETVRAKVRARRYAGGVPAKTRYDVFLYRTMLDAPAWVDDAGMGGQGSAVTYGTPSTTEGTLSVPKRLYSSVSDRMKDKGSDEDPWASAQLFDPEGEAAIEVTVPPLDPGEERLPFKYTLSVRARDEQGTFASASKNYFFAESELLVSVAPSAKSVVSGGVARVSVRATTLGGKPYGDAEGALELLLRKADGTESKLPGAAIHTAADGLWRGAVPTSEIGTVIARAVLSDKAGHASRGEASLIVVGKNGEPVARVPALVLDTLAGVLEPGGQAQLIGLLPEAWGPGKSDRGPIWLTLSGGSIFDTKLIEQNGDTLVYSFPIERRFGSAVYASIAYPTASGRWEERTVPFRIVPSERVLTVRAEARSAEAPPLGKQTLDIQVRDASGRGVAAQVSVGVVDKAIYALQTELRPRILDFFYPIARNNVMSFYSAEFQGYGYGDVIARAGGLRPYEFAAIKPPSRKPKDQERDTAYWNASIVTDREGHAVVSFDLPSNQTLWTVTAVAADVAGRFGESTSEFATRGAMNVVASLPQFLREGDTAAASIRVSRGSEADAAAQKALEVDVTLGPSLTGPEPASVVRQKLEVPKEGEAIVPITLTAHASSGLGNVAVKVLGGQGPLSSSRDVTLAPAAVEHIVVATAAGGGELALPVTKEEQVESVELVLQPSVLDAALAAVKDLLEYPYGCLEQLVATTIPNIAVVRTLEKAGALSALDPDSSALLVEARSRAVQGVQRILQLEVKGGGFTLFSGYSAPSVELTLIALDGLSYAVEAGLADRDDPRIVESVAWLTKSASKEELPFDLDATRTYVLSRIEGPKHAAEVRALIDKAPPGDLYSLALSVLAAEQAGIREEPGLKERVLQLAAKSRDGIAGAASYDFTGSGAFWRYPLRRIGLTAILAHAASFGELDVAPVRRRLIDALADTTSLSTFEKSTVLLHSQWLIERDAKAMKAIPPPTLELPGASSAVRPKLAPRAFGWAAALPDKTTKVKLGNFDGTAVLRARVLTPLSIAKPASEGMSIAREYFVLREGGMVPLGAAGGRVTQGEEVFVQLKVDAHDKDTERGRWNRSAYYLVEDFVPAGFEPLIEDKAFRAAPYSLPLAHEALRKRSLSEAHATFFFEEPAWWSSSPRLIGYVMRAQFSGKFSAPPAKVEDMYAPLVRGNSAPASLEVVPSKG